jgi:competence protein ComEC
MRTWHSMPFVRLVLPFCMGIVTASFLPFLSTSVALALTIFAFFSFLFLSFFQTNFRFRWLFGIPLSIFLFSIAYLLTAWHDDRQEASHFSQFLKEPTESTVLGVVEDKVEKEKSIRIILKIKELSHNSDSIKQASGNLLLYLKKDSTLTTTPQYGDVLVLKTTIREIELPKNPDAIDFKQYWHFQNIHYQGFIKVEDFKILAHDRGNWLIAKAKAWNAHFVAILRENLTSEDEFAVGSALVLGSKDAVSEEIKKAYIETGAMHILAISGMHILLIFSQLERILNLYKTGNRRVRWVKTVVLIFLIILFALLTGLGSSIVRAAVMASFVAIGKTMNQHNNALNLLAASAFCLLLFNPFWLFDIGFQLSYVAVIGITLFADKFKKIVTSKNKLLNYVWQNISIGLAAQLAVTPLALYYFHQFPTYFWLTGLLVGVVADWALMAGVVLLIVNHVPLLGWVASKILFGTLWAMNHLIFIIQKLPLNLIEGFWLSLGSVILLYGCISGFWVAFQSRKLRFMYYPLSILLILTTFYAFSSVKNQQIKQLIIYHIPKKSLIEIYMDKKCYSFSEKFSKNIDTENRIKFAAQNHRNSLKTNDLITFDFNEYVKYDNFIYHNGYMQVGSVKVAVLDILPKTPLSLPTEFVVLRNNPKLRIQELKQIFGFTQIIFDASNSKWRVEEWKKECHTLGYNFHDVAEKGAWVYNF